MVLRISRSRISRSLETLRSLLLLRRRSHRPPSSKPSGLDLTCWHRRILTLTLTLVLIRNPTSRAERTTPDRQTQAQPTSTEASDPISLPPRRLATAQAELTRPHHLRALQQLRRPRVHSQRKRLCSHALALSSRDSFLFPALQLLSLRRRQAGLRLCLLC